MTPLEKEDKNTLRADVLLPRRVSRALFLSPRWFIRAGGAKPDGADTNFPNILQGHSRFQTPSRLWPLQERPVDDDSTASFRLGR